MDNGTNKSDSPHWPIFYFGIFLFLISLPQYVFQTINPEGDFECGCRGFEALLLGWIALPASLAWLANPLMLTVGFLMWAEKWVAALTVASTAVGCSLMTFWGFKPFPMGNPPENVLCIGALFWFAAIACVWLSAFMAWRHKPLSNAQNPAAF